MPADAAMPGMQDREGEHREREDREQMDWAPWAPDAQLMDPERARRHRHHEQDPNPAKRAMGQRALGRGKHAAGWRAFFLKDAQTTEIYTLSLHDALPI